MAKKSSFLKQNPAKILFLTNYPLNMYRIHLPNRRFLLLLILSFAGIFNSCTTKEVVISEREKVVNYLTGMGNRYWHIKDIYTNGVKQALTPAQLSFYKTYTIKYGTGLVENTGVWTDGNGFIGSWEVIDVKHIHETVQNAPTGPVLIKLTINKIGTYELDVEYTANGQTIRSVYIGY